MSMELYWLVLTCLLTGVIWIPYIINRLIEGRWFPALWNPMPDTRPKALWAERMMRAHENAVENLVVFAPLVIVVEITQLNNSTTAWAAMVFFWTRIAHLLVFTFAVPLLRPFIFVAGFIAQLSLAIELLSA